MSKCEIVPSTLCMFYQSMLLSFVHSQVICKFVCICKCSRCLDNCQGILIKTCQTKEFLPLKEIQDLEISLQNKNKKKIDKTLALKLKRPNRNK